MERGIHPPLQRLVGEDDSPFRNFLFASFNSFYDLLMICATCVICGLYIKRDSMARGGQALMHSSHPLHLEVSKITSMVLRLM